MVDSLPPSGTDPDNKTIITNSNGKLSVPFDGVTLAVGSSGKVEFFEPTEYLTNFDYNPGDWTGIDSVSDGFAKVNVGPNSTHSASVTADLTDIDALKFKVEADFMPLKIKFDGNLKGTFSQVGGYQTLEISGLDYGTNTTITIEGSNDGSSTKTFLIDYVRDIGGV